MIMNAVISGSGKCQHPPHRKTYRDQEKQLQEELQAKKSLVETLQEEHEMLQRQSQLAQQLLDSFDWFQRQHSTGQSSVSIDDMLLEAMLEDHELEFMIGSSSSSNLRSHWRPQQQCDNPHQASLNHACQAQSSTSGSNSCGSGSHGLSMDDWQKPIAPDSDMLWLARKVLGMGDYPNLQSMSISQLGEAASAITCKLALCLQQLEAGAGTIPNGRTQQQLLTAVESMLCKQMQLKKTLTLKSPTTFLQLLALNCDTGGLGAVNMDRYQFLVEQLHLSSEQKQRIAASYMIAEHLMVPILKERQQLQGGGSCSAAAAAAAAATSSAAPAGNSSHHHASSFEGDSGLSGLNLAGSWDGYKNMPRPLSFANSDMTLQQFRIARLERVSRKEWFMRLMAGYSIKATLSWLQMAKVYVLMSPHFPQYCLLARAVKEQLDQEAQHQTGPDHVAACPADALAMSWLPR